MVRRKAKARKKEKVELERKRVSIFPSTLLHSTLPWTIHIMEERIRVCFGWMNLEGLESPILLYTMRPLQAKSLFLSLTP